MIDSKLQLKLTKLQEAMENGAYPDDVKTVMGWADQLRETALQHNLYKHPAMKPVWKAMQSEIDGINTILMEKPNLEDRETLLRYRNLVRATLTRFSEAMKRNEEIQDRIEQESAHVSSQLNTH